MSVTHVTCCDAIPKSAPRPNALALQENQEAEVKELKQQLERTFEKKAAIKDNPPNGDEVRLVLHQLNVCANAVE